MKLRRFLSILLVMSAALCHGQTWTLPAGTTPVTNSAAAAWGANTAALIGSSSTLNVANAGASWTKGISGTGTWGIASSNNRRAKITGTLNLASGVGLYGDTATNYPGAGITINVVSGSEMNYGGGTSAISSARACVATLAGALSSFDRTLPS